MAKRSYDSSGLTPKADKDFIELARTRFTSAQSAEKDQRRRELDDIQFYDGDQWPADAKAARAPVEASGKTPALPGRPMITINETRAPVRNVLNQERNSDLGIELVPADDFGDIDDTPENKAEIEGREGLIRRIQRESEAKSARTWGFTRAVICGRGYYEVALRYLPGKTFDQEVYVNLIYNQASVTIDPNHQNPSGSDAEWEFIGSWIPWAEYKRRWPKIANGDRNPIAELGAQDFKSLGEDMPQWFRGEEKKGADQRAVHVVRYYYADYTERELIEWSDGTLFWKDDEPKERPGGITVNGSRIVQERTIKWAMIDGHNVLDKPEDWPSLDMPIVQILGEELHPYDEQKRAEGMVRPAREANIGLNYMVSKMVEMIGITPIPPLFVAEGQIEGYEDQYQASTTRVMSHLTYRTRDLEGNAVGAPSSVQRETPIQAVATSIAMFNEKIQSTMNVHDPSLGKTDPALRSGKAINSVIAADMHGTSNFLDNLVRSMEYEGKVINNLLYPVYGRKPGRIARILNQEGEPETIQVSGPPAPNAPQMQPAMRGDMPVRQFTLTPNARMNVAVKVAKNFDTRRQQEAAIVGEMLSANPANMLIFGDLFFKNLDGPGHNEMAERVKVMLDPKVQQMLQAKQSGQQPVPPEVQQQMAQMQEVVETQQQVIEQLEKDKEGKVLDNQGKAAIADINARKDIELQQQESAVALEKARMDNETKLAVAELGAKVERLILFMEERARVGMQEHELNKVGAQSAADRQLESDAHLNTLQQTEQQAALAPPPTETTA